MDTKQESYKRVYLSNLVALPDLKDFEDALPCAELNNYNDLMIEIIALLEKDQKTWDELYETGSKEEQPLFWDEKQLIQQKLNLVCNKLYEEIKQEKIEEEVEKTREYNGLYFATNIAGNVMLERDMKIIQNNVDDRVYTSFIDLIKMANDGYDSFHIEKQRPLGEDDRLKGLYEFKSFQARLIYRYVGKSIIIVGAYLKKTDTNSKYKDCLINMKKHSNQYIEDLKKNINNEEYTSNLKLKSLEIYNNIIGIGKVK